MAQYNVKICQKVYLKNVVYDNLNNMYIRLFSIYNFVNLTQVWFHGYNKILTIEMF